MNDDIGSLPVELRRMYLKQRQGLPLSVKVQMSLRRIRDWYEANNGLVYVAFSGGKDSTVLLYLVRLLYPEVPAVFADTGLEFPEIREFVKNTENVVWVKPKMNFKKVLETYGYPVVSKNVAMAVNRYRTTKSQEQRDYRLNGRVIDGKKQTAGTIPKKWKHLIDAPFKVSEKCCDIMKKNPMKVYEKITGRKPYVGVMATDSALREEQIIKNGCNSFERGTSQPLAFWREDDIWEYLGSANIPYCSVYQYEKRTGCIFCLFGCNYDHDRVERLKRYPDLYKYCVEQLKLQEVLDYTLCKQEPKR